MLSLSGGEVQANAALLESCRRELERVKKLNGAFEESIAELKAKIEKALPTNFSKKSLKTLTFLSFAFKKFNQFFRFRTSYCGESCTTQSRS